MRKRANILGLLGLAAAMFWGQTEARAVITTPTQAAGIALTDTDWGPQTTSLLGSNPLVFSQFNPSLGKLLSVNITYQYVAQESVTLAFTSSSMTTITARTSEPQNPNLGTVLTLNNPGDASNIFTATLPVLTYTRTDGGAGVSALNPKIYSTNPAIAPIGSPYFLTPDGQPGNASNTSSGSMKATLTDPTSLALFTGTGTIGLPAHATAHDSFTSNTGNGGATILTQAGVLVTISYTYVPEPSSWALLGLGGGSLLLLGRRRRRAV